MSKKSYIKIAFSVLAILVIIALANQVNAEVAQIRYKYANTAIAGLSIKSGTASVSCMLTGKNGVVSKIKGTMILQKRSNGKWNNVKSWNEEKNGNKLSIAKSKVVSHGTYRTKATFKVYSGNKSETISVYSASKEY